MTRAPMQLHGAPRAAILPTGCISSAPGHFTLFRRGLALHTCACAKATPGPFAVILCTLFNHFASLHRGPGLGATEGSLSLRKRERVRVRVRLDCVDTADQVI